ncbi:MAG: hypothetical protein IPL22_16890 [Bacteroidetes bacterium]|nr:hypothetical protein [Bacteroidota bacterium]
MNQFSEGSLPGRSDATQTDPVRRTRYEELVRDTIRELYSNARYWEFFKGFNEESVHDFITEYASKKAWYLLNGERLLLKKEKEHFRFRELAEKCFWEIQQKKLFNLQAEWRAGLIELPGVEVTRDFLCWEKAIATCPFLDPVTPNELSFYMDYLESGMQSDKNWFYNWQDYDTYRHAENCPEAIPAWYRYYDSKYGTDYLMMLPDKKGEEEKLYIREWRKQNSSSQEAELHEEELLTGPGPNLYVNYETLDFFISTFESRNLKDYFLAAELKPEDETNDAELQDALRILSRAGKNVTLPKATDWREAIIAGAAQYKSKRIMANLPFVYDEYLFRLKNGIAQRPTDEDQAYQEYIAFTTLYRHQVNEGRKITEQK